MCSQELGNFGFVFSHIYNYTHAIKQNSNKCELFICFFFQCHPSHPSPDESIHQITGEQALIQSEASPYLVSE